MSGFWRSGHLALMLATVLTACATPKAPYTELSVQPVNQGLVHSQFFVGKLGDVSFSGASVVRTFAQDGKVAVCGVYRLTAPVDLRDKFRYGLKAEASSLEIKTFDGKSIVRLSPAFMSLSYKKAQVSLEQANVNQAMGIGEKEAIPAACVQTQVPWQPEFFEYKASLDLFLPVAYRAHG